ncbi:MAG: hypothetical protein EZS28_051174 [Streblomastix strix]|uniref:Uncharacterized protein n=1 Tax=Streblomastix strix TaxID=222440 RepID=A0A5J4T4G3_9EUKA|nr:MAG: hypothetical protein EZS28_051174 [Streblomastix strix]
MSQLPLRRIHISRNADEEYWDECVEIVSKRAKENRNHCWKIILNNGPRKPQIIYKYKGYSASVLLQQYTHPGQAFPLDCENGHYCTIGFRMNSTHSRSVKSKDN